MLKFGASLITLDHLNIYQDVKFLTEIEQISYLHIDVMDGHYVPRYGVYPEIVKEIQKFTNIELDLHLMVDDPLFAIQQFTNDVMVKTISFHISNHLDKCYSIIDAIRDVGSEAVLAIDLSTPISDVLEILHENEVSGIMFMGIIPGVLDQTHRPEIVYKKCREILKLTEGYDLKFKQHIQIDGGFNFNTAANLKACGINNFVGGSSTFFSGMKENMDFASRRQKVLENTHNLMRKLDD